MDLASVDVALSLALRVIWHALVVAAGFLIGAAGQGIRDAQKDQTHRARQNMFNNMVGLLSNGYARLMVAARAIGVMSSGAAAVACRTATIALPIAHFAATAAMFSRTAAATEGWDGTIIIALLVSFAGTVPGGPGFLSLHNPVQWIADKTSGVVPPALWAVVPLTASITAAATFYGVSQDSWVASAATWVVTASLCADAGAATIAPLRSVKATLKERKWLDNKLRGMRDNITGRLGGLAGRGRRR